MRINWDNRQTEPSEIAEKLRTLAEEIDESGMHPMEVSRTLKDLIYQDLATDRAMEMRAEVREALAGITEVGSEIKEEAQQEVRSLQEECGIEEYEIEDRVIIMYDQEGREWYSRGEEPHDPDAPDAVHEFIREYHRIWNKAMDRMWQELEDRDVRAIQHDEESVHAEFGHGGLTFHLTMPYYPTDLDRIKVRGETRVPLGSLGDFPEKEQLDEVEQDDG